MRKKTKQKNYFYTIRLEVDKRTKPFSIATEKTLNGMVLLFDGPYSEYTEYYKYYEHFSDALKFYRKLLRFNSNWADVITLKRETV